MLNGKWAEDDPRRLFVAGAKWWEFESRGATMWNSDVNDAEAEAEKRFPGGKISQQAVQDGQAENTPRSNIKDAFKELADAVGPDYNPPAT